MTDTLNSNASQPSTGEQQSATAAAPQGPLTDDQIKSAISERLSKTEGFLDRLIADAHEKFHNGINYYLSALRVIATAQAKELAIFHKFETHVRQQTLEDHHVQELLNLLTSHRESVKQAAEKPKS